MLLRGVDEPQRTHTIQLCKAMDLEQKKKFPNLTTLTGMDLEEEKKELLHSNPSPDEADDDPGMVFMFASDNEIHNVLGLPSTSRLRPTLQQGHTPTDSKRHLLVWLDIVVSNNGARQFHVYLPMETQFYRKQLHVRYNFYIPTYISSRK